MHLTLCSAFIMGFSPAPWMLFTLPERWDLLTVSWVADDSLHWILIRLPQLLLDFPAWSRHLFVAKTELTPSSAKTLLFLCSLSYPCPQTLTPNINWPSGPAGFSSTLPLTSSLLSHTHTQVSSLSQTVSAVSCLVTGWACLPEIRLPHSYYRELIKMQIWPHLLTSF